VYLRCSVVRHPSQPATTISGHPCALHGVDDLGLSHFAYKRAISPGADARDQRFDLGHHAAIQTHIGANHRLPLFQSSRVGVPVLDRAVLRDKISKARAPAMDATKVVTWDSRLNRGNRAADSPPEVRCK